MSPGKTHIPPWPGVSIESDRTVWDGRFPVQLVSFRQRRFDGQTSGPRTWEMMRRGAAAAVLPYDPDTDEVLMIQQFRLPALAGGFDPVLDEIPAGLCDGEDGAEATALRETQEEAHVALDRLRRVGRFLLTAGGSDENATLFIGRMRAPPADGQGVVGIGGLAAEQEDIRILLRPAAAAIATALDGGYANIITTTALLWLAARREALRAEWVRP
jgi:ADP-ribose pyrophosphatase